jgi:hypothetical protein
MKWLYLVGIPYEGQTVIVDETDARDLADVDNTHSNRSLHRFAWSGNELVQERFVAGRWISVDPDRAPIR